MRDFSERGDTVERKGHNAIVKYENRFNMVALRNFNVIDNNILFAIVSRLRDKQSRVITLDYDHLMRLAKYNTHISFNTYLKKLSVKLQGLAYVKENNDGFEVISLFTSFKADNRSKTLSIRVNPEFSFFFNDIKQWTRFSLRQYTSISSSYAQIAFRNLKQFRTKGQYWISLEQMREFYDIPKSYRTSDINRRVIKQIKKELTPYFRNLNISPTKHGRRISGYNFTWTPEKNDVDEVKVSDAEKLNRSINNIRFNGHLSDSEKKAALDSLLKRESSVTKATVLSLSGLLDDEKDKKPEQPDDKSQAEEQFDPKKDFKTEVFEKRISEDHYREVARQFFRTVVAKLDKFSDSSDPKDESKVMMLTDAKIKLRKIDMYEKGQQI